MQKEVKKYDLLMFFIGASMGSFMQCITENRDISVRRSQCENCGHQLHWYELLPIISYLFLKGQCRLCKQQIPLRHICIECIFGIMFILVFHHTTNHLLMIHLLIISFILPLSLYDIEHYQIPNKILIIMMASVMIIICLQYLPIIPFQQNEPYIQCSSVYIFIKGAIILLLHLFYFLTKSIGYGDIKILSILSIILDPSYFVAMFLMMYIVGGLCAIVFLCYKSEIKKIPFVPFIFAGYILVVLLYDEIHIIFLGGFY